jgi:hypothetical protein
MSTSSPTNGQFAYSSSDLTVKLELEVEISSKSWKVIYYQDTENGAKIFNTTALSFETSTPPLPCKFQVTTHYTSNTHNLKVANDCFKLIASRK